MTKQPPEVFYKKVVLKNFAIFTGKNCVGVSLIKLEAQLFSGEYCKIFQNTYSEEHLQTAASEVSGEIAFGSISLFYVNL